MFSRLKHLSFVKIALIAFCYFIIAKIGLLMSVDYTNASPIWLPTGFALASVLLWGNVSCIGIFAGALTVMS
ncbi:MAG: hypothetical protein E3K37_11590 [Candidatus Kuenenia sp.]|nr:hypothetical protein [Candidatus Kuenenia hertensis]